MGVGGLRIPRNNLLSSHKYNLRKARSTSDLLAYEVLVWSSALEPCDNNRMISANISTAFH